jgi:hypothetical protein
MTGICWVTKVRSSCRRHALEIRFSVRQGFEHRAMKRLIVIVCCLFVIFAGAASAWANCKQAPFGSEDHRRSSDAIHTHDHHTDSHDEHSPGTVIHCPTLDEFLLTAIFSANTYERVERLPAAVVEIINAELGRQSSNPSIHGPPGFSRLNGIPPYLLLSVLRI